MFGKTKVFVLALSAMVFFAGCNTSISEGDFEETQSTFSIEYYNTMGLENQNPGTYQKDEDVTLADLSKVNYKFAGWYLNDTGNPIKGWSAGSYRKDLALYAKWTYPDEVKVVDGKYGYACDKSLNYTITVSTSYGGYSTKLNFKSGDSFSKLKNGIKVEDVPYRALIDGVVWTISVSAVNENEGLKYKGKTTQEVKDSQLSFTFPVLKRES